jgi:5-(carboxyamino)imidazole ribonucleotide synthase
LWPEAGEPDWSPVLNHPDAHLHLYDKGEARPGRKMCHFDLTGTTLEAAKMEADRIWSRL